MVSFFTAEQLQSTQQQQSQQTQRKQKQKQKTEKSTTGVTTADQTAKQSGTQAQTAFGQANLDVLNQLVQDLALERGSGQGQQLTSAITESVGSVVPQALKGLLAFGSQDRRAETQSALEAGARLRFNRDTLPQVEQAAQQAGSKEGSFAGLLRGRAETDFQTQLAEINAQLGLQLDDQSIKALSAAVQGGGVAGQTAQSLGGGNDLVQALQLAKGAEVSGQTTQQSAAQSTQQQKVDEIASLLATLIDNTNTTATSSGTTTANKTPSILEGITGLLSAGGGAARKAATL